MVVHRRSLAPQGWLHTQLRAWTVVGIGVIVYLASQSKLALNSTSSSTEPDRSELVGDSRT